MLHSRIPSPKLAINNSTSFQMSQSNNFVSRSKSSSSLAYMANKINNIDNNSINNKILSNNLRAQSAFKKNNI